MPLADIITNQIPERKISAVDFAKKTLSYYRSLYPAASDTDVVDLYYLLSDFALAQFAYHNDPQYQERRSRYLGMQLGVAQVRALLGEVEKVALPSELPFEDYYADYLARGTASPYYSKFLAEGAKLWSGFMLFMMTVCFRTLCGNLYSAPLRDDNRLARFIPELDGKTTREGLLEFPFLWDAKIPMIYQFSAENEETLKYLFMNYNVAKLREMWVNILSERVPEIVCEGEPKEFLGKLFDVGHEWVTKGNWEDFVGRKGRLNWVCSFNNAPELALRYRRSFVTFFGGHKHPERFTAASNVQ